MDSDPVLEDVELVDLTFMADIPPLEEPKVVIALDFGTAFAGFAWALASNPEDVWKCYSWPQMEAVGADRYCKAPTCLWYTRGDLPGTLELNDWGYGAQLKYYEALESPKYFTDSPVQIRKSKRKMNTTESIPRWNAAECSIPTEAGEFVRIEVKLHSHLAHSAGSGSAEVSGLQHNNHSCAASNSDKHTRILPKGITVLRAISDYLKKMGEFALATVQKGSPELATITNEDVQWCLTLPAIWTEKAKGEMRTCMETAGLVRGRACKENQSASPHDMIIVLEAEASSVYCQRNLSKKNDLMMMEKGAKIMVVDIGACTVDVVVHEKMEDLKFKEVTPTDSDLCGGMFVDQAFFKLLAAKVDRFAELGKDYPCSMVDMRKSWETVKHNFGGTVTFPNSNAPFLIEVPDRLASAWKFNDRHGGKDRKEDRLKYKVVRLTRKDLERIFDPTVHKVLQVIQRNLVPELATILLVGGFSSSPYLQKQIQEHFKNVVTRIITTDEPENAVLSGAIIFGTQVGVDIVISRISRKTYGVCIVRPFQSYDPDTSRLVDHNGDLMCKDGFQALVRIGDEVLFNHSVDLALEPWHSVQEKSLVGLYSADFDGLGEDGSDPMYITDKGVKREGYFVISHPRKEELGIPTVMIPLLKLLISFGQTTIQVAGEGNNSGLRQEGTMFSMPIVSFETTSDPTKVEQAANE